MARAARFVAVAGVLAAVPLTELGPAQAAPPRVLSGDVQVIFFEELSRRVVGNGNVTLTVDRNESLVTGGATSTAPQQERARCVIHADSLTCHGSVVFTGTVEGSALARRRAGCTCPASSPPACAPVGRCP
jgi:hypothetical protein